MEATQVSINRQAYKKVVVHDGILLGRKKEMKSHHLHQYEWIEGIC